MPHVPNIPQRHFENPSKLILYLFQNSYFEPVLASTNNRIREKVPNPDNHLITMTELLQYRAIDHLANQNFLKPTHMNFKTWFKNINYLAKPHIGDKNLDIKLSRTRFDFISKHIDSGENILIDKKIKQGARWVTCTRPNSNQPIRIYDLNKKIDGLIDGLNTVFLKFKNPDSRVLTLDESFRKSFSKKDQLRSFLPNKPDKYGHKYQSLCDSDAYVHFLKFNHSGQFSLWNDLSGLLDIMVPEKYKYKGVTLCCDNYYLTYDGLKMLHSQGISAFGTFQKNRIGKVMGQNVVKELTKKVPKSQFSRKFDLFETELDSRLYGSGQFIQFGFFWDKREKVVQFGTNDPRLFNHESNPHKSAVLNRNEKPNMVHVYNESKGYVDELDRMMTQFTCVRPYRNGRCIRRFLANIWDFCLNNGFILFRNFYMHQSQFGTRYNKLANERILRSTFYYEALFGLIGFKARLSDLERIVPNSGPFDRADCKFENPPHPKRARTSFKCAKCTKYVCQTHSLVICNECYRDHIF